MTFSKTLCLFAFAIFALTFASATTNSVCLKEVEGHLFNLCPFKDPINVIYQTGQVWDTNFTLSLLEPTVPSCNDTSVNGWMAVFNRFMPCSDAVTHSPVYNYTMLGFGMQGLKITYQTDDGEDPIVVSLLCNRTGLHNADINFYVEVDGNPDLILSGYSYYACPIKTDGRKFLQFDD